jgi:molecular chaperone HscA
MALLQISEPGASCAPQQRRHAIGIDLGTTHSLVATVLRQAPEILEDEAGRALLPSVVHYGASGARRVGHEALAMTANDPNNTILSVKRLMGRSLDEACLLSTAYDLVDGPGMVSLRTVQGILSPVAISADILTVLRRRAEAVLGDEVVDAVITVPAYFDDAQRQATRDAARLAGLNVLRLLNEPTAAAIAYGLEHASEGIYVVYDLGGGTFDVSILKLSRGVFEVIATGGDTLLGGDDFDDSLVQWLMTALPEVTHWSAQDERALKMAARQARERLSETTQTQVDCPLQAGTAVHVGLSRAQLETLIAPLLERTLRCVRRALQDAKLVPAAVKGVVMVGGATRTPCVQRAVHELFGQTPLTNLDPDKVVALGAALQANLLVGNRLPGDDWLLLDVIPLSLGLETLGGLVERIIPRNSTIPTVRAQEFTTFKDGQRAMSLHIVQGERELVSDCRSLARFELQNIPPLVAGAARIRVTFQVDADGLLGVTAREQSTGVEATITVKPSYGLSDEEMARMLAESISLADADAQVRMLREQQVDARRLVESVRAALVQDADLLDDASRARVDAALAAAELAPHVDDVESVRAAVRTLSEATEDFAACRMDRNIRAALAGRNVDELM